MCADVQDAQAVSDEQLITGTIMLGASFALVVTAINLDHQPQCMAVEVDN